eukprot:7588143-Heterocapsa_arctica.AAC.1
MPRRFRAVAGTGCPDLIVPAGGVLPLVVLPRLDVVVIAGPLGMLAGRVEVLAASMGPTTLVPCLTSRMFA